MRLPNGRSKTSARAGFLWRRYPRSVAGRYVVEMSRIIIRASDRHDPAIIPQGAVRHRVLCVSASHSSMDRYGSRRGRRRVAEAKHKSARASAAR